MPYPAIAAAVIVTVLASAYPPAAQALPLAGSIGAALQAAPAYPGASGYDAGLRPTGRLRWGDRLHLDLRAPATASWAVAEPGKWRFAGLAQYLPGRSDALRDDYPSLDAQAPGLGLGATAERRRGPLSFRLGIFGDATRGDGGWGGWAAAEAQTRLGLTPWVAGLEGLLEAGNDALLAQRLGVTAGEAAGVSRLSRYRPSGGLARATLRATAVYLISPDWALVGRAAGTRLGPALAASPLAETPWQGRLSAGLLYRF